VWLRAIRLLFRSFALEARAIGTKHPNWRAWVTQDSAGRRQTIKLQVEDAKEKGK